MVNGQTGSMELLSDLANDKRSNIISRLSILYKKLNSGAGEQDYKFENYHIVFRNGILEVHGCIDDVRVTGPKYSEVHLGRMISNYGQLPYYWIEGIIS
ncbi:hypothetical protein EHV15_34385 [Paenibacillus oralis]|uniref:Uncharacterized protein n=1 Tax=Paenibacillus oralis TaxID=2490856 RepID=A0A3P3TC63_9BACL|nr:hypothetical protein [Paenibacillus oralis]RRJ54688.1 hypothetical protein EHV15_34385 [Paenibacillus oralis]